MTDTCPLCGARRGLAREHYSYSETWAALERAFSAEFGDALKARLTPSPEADLVECGSCGLQYFSPAREGDPEFYARLMTPMGYDPLRWEFEVVAAVLRPDDRLVDFGCGDGAFLKLAAPRVSSAVGIDHNEDAVAALHRAGFDAHAGGFDSLPDSERGTFGVACAFQVLEHMLSPEELLEPMIESLRTGGRLFLAVPNRERCLQEELEPLDRPPHHVTRWSARQLGPLAERFGLKLVRREFAPPTLGEAVELARRSAPLPGRAVGALWWRVLVGSRRHRRRVEAGVYHLRGIHGHTLLAELEK